MTPGELRRRTRIESLRPSDGRLPTALQLERTLVLEPERKMRPAFRLVGLSGRFDRDSRAQIPLLWDRLVPRLPLAGQKGAVTYGACWSANTEEGSFNYMAAVEIEPGSELPDDVETLDVSAQTYAVFRQAIDASNLHAQMSAACDEIWGNRLTREGLKPSGGPDFEFYPEDFAPRRPGFLQYYVPVNS